MWVFGNNVFGQLGLGDKVNRLTPIKIPDLKAKFVACGGNHTAVINQDNNVLTSGLNNRGQLGLGDQENRIILEQIPNLKAKTTSVAC
uniref:Regulator of chromosome condensation protein n=1 Tax=Marseillevirus LCMAC102 TaxID=2506603 RepID=A0A481YTX3_9VIRU|nr:MAG: regulator of chromosome condensation protein [Marseillevirus LCMAC102]